jgi:transcriptional regulator with XRE-family HTH domain
MEEKIFKMKKFDGSKLQYLRKKKGLTGEDFAKKVGLKGRSDVSVYETNRIENPSIERIKVFAKALDCSPDDLMSDVEGEATRETIAGAAGVSPELFYLASKLAILDDTDFRAVLLAVQILRRAQEDSQRQ